MEKEEIFAGFSADGYILDRDCFSFLSYLTRKHQRLRLDRRL